MRDIVLSLGSNVGDSAVILQGAVDDLAAAEGVELAVASGVFETDPVGGPEQRAFLNLVVLGRTSLLDHELLATTQAIEQHWHRTREVRWGPRTLDIDIIAIADESVDTPDLIVPHALAHERAFVLVPWLDADPDAYLVGHGAIADLVAGLDASGVRDCDVVVTVPRVG
ncbi:MAG: 2-amino-4-hydroxy-6-hydroxymethyldihydropteridine diphosphokinase [Actinomycetes bacterium]